MKKWTAGQTIKEKQTLKLKRRLSARKLVEVADAEKLEESYNTAAEYVEAELTELWGCDAFKPHVDGSSRMLNSTLLEELSARKILTHSEFAVLGISEESPPRVW